MTVDEIKTYYADLLIAQYKNKIRARATIGLMAQEMSCDALMLGIRDAFDLNTAIGAQLDVLGRIVGVHREIYGLDLTHDFFEFAAYSGSPAGTKFQYYADTLAGPELITRYRTAGSYIMPDFDYRALIRLKIIYNTMRESMKDIKEALFASFAGLIDIVDNENMTVGYIVKRPYISTMVVASYIGIVPKPMGVGVNISYVTNI